MTDKIEAALKRAYILGQLYWQQADCDSFIQHKKSDETQAKFNALVHETLTLLREAAQPEPVSLGIEMPKVDTCSEELARVRADAEVYRSLLKETGLLLHHFWCDVKMNEYSFDKLNKGIEAIDAAIAAQKEG